MTHSPTGDCLLQGTFQAPVAAAAAADDDDLKD